ncbi:MAG TPA: zinc-dependent metalloprotease, partial [Bacteriovoracaceae bacterium]|nr:zinc-dependent metalloprotease [Bacteriovoracaceae bacterium]
MNPSILALCALGVLSTACIENSSPKKLKRVELNSSSVDALLGDEYVDIKVLNKSVLSQKKLNNKILKPNSKKALETLAKLPQGVASAESIARSSAIEQETLLLGLPIGLIGEQNIFGGVITDVSDRNNEDLGMLKLTDLSPIHVKSVITGLSTGNPAVTLIGCANDCSELSEQGALISFPMVGFDEESMTILLDMSAVGQELDLVSMLDPNGDFTQLRAIGSSTTNVEYSLSTLVFDIKTDMVPADGSDNSKITSFNVRWYLKLTSGFNPAFETRNPTKGVGFFTTERSAKPKIQRFSATNDGSSVHYYLKGVPDRQKKNFSGSIDNWNKEFREVLGRDLLTYEFIDVDDPRYNEIVAGDIRYNVIEWDLNHKAPYAGLGPSIANQYTGEIFSANVLVQGEMTEEMYASWYRVSDQVRERQAQGKIQEAQKLLKDFNLEVQSKLDQLSKRTFKLKLGKKLEMRVNSQRPELQDQIPRVFELTPEGVSYQEFVDRYMHDTIEHEIGHNLGLRHNFKGTLGAIEGDERGTASRSVMEYLPNLHVIKSGIGEYDRMALSYGYTGVLPYETNWFCTD